mgnify:CR=1 FL=1
MKKKLFKFLIAASVITIFASFASLAASITIVENSEKINTETGEVSINFTPSEDMKDTDKITALVYKGGTNTEPVDTNVVYIDQNTKSSYNGTLSFKMKEDVESGTACTLRMGGTGVETAAVYDFTYENPTISVSKTAGKDNGIAELSAGVQNGDNLTVQQDTEVSLNVTPKIGYYISSVTKNGEAILASFDAYAGGTYTFTAKANTEFEVTFEEITDVTDALTLPEVFKGEDTRPTSGSTPVTVAIAFGQIVTAKTPVEWGIYLTYQNGIPVTTKSTKVGPYFKADSKSTQDNQFGVMFSGLKVGKYYAQTYVKYGENNILLNEYSIKANICEKIFKNTLDFCIKGCIINPTV